MEHTLTSLIFQKKYKCNLSTYFQSQLRPPPDHGAKTTDTHPSTTIRSPQKCSITPLPSPSIQFTEPTSYHQKPPSNLAQHSRSGRRKQHRTAVLHVQDKLKPTMSPYLSPAMSIKSHESNRVMNFKPSALVPSTPRSQRSYRSDSTQVRTWEGNATRILCVD